MALETQDVIVDANDAGGESETRSLLPCAFGTRRRERQWRENASRAFLCLRGIHLSTHGQCGITVGSFSRGITLKALTLNP